MIRQEIQSVYDIGKKNSEHSQKFIDSSHDLLETVEAICDGESCDEMIFIKVANSLGTMVTAFKETQKTYGDVYTKLIDIMENQANAENNIKPFTSKFKDWIATISEFCNRVSEIMMNLYKSRHNKVKL